MSSAFLLTIFLLPSSISFPFQVPVIASWVLHYLPLKVKCCSSCFISWVVGKVPIHLALYCKSFFSQWGCRPWREVAQLGPAVVFLSFLWVRCSQVSQLIWWAYCSSALPERACWFRGSPALLEGARLPTSLCECGLAHLYGFALIHISLAVGRLLIIWFYLIETLFLQIIWSCLLLGFVLISWPDHWNILHMLPL